MKSVARFITRYPKTLFFSYMALSMWPVFFIRPEFNASYEIAFKFLGAPIVIGSWIFGLCHREVFLAACRRSFAYWLSMVALPLLAVLFSGGLVLQANALIPPQREFLFEGTVTGKFVSGGKSITWIVEVLAHEETRRIEVTKSEYEAAKVGSQFQQKRWLGPLGFSYVWK